MNGVKRWNKYIHLYVIVVGLPIAKNWPKVEVKHVQNTFHFRQWTIDFVVLFSGDSNTGIKKNSDFLEKTHLDPFTSSPLGNPS